MSEVEDLRKKLAEADQRIAAAEQQRDGYMESWETACKRLNERNAESQRLREALAHRINDIINALGAALATPFGFLLFWILVALACMKYC